LIGLLTNAKTSDGRTILDTNALILIASCMGPRSAASAIAEELRIFVHWYHRKSRSLFANIDWKSAASIRKVLGDLRRAYGYLAVNSARFKLNGVWDERPRTIVKECADYLSGLPQGEFLKDQWLGDWQPVIDSTFDAEAAKFQPLFERVAHHLFVAAIGVFTCEVALTSAYVLTKGGVNAPLLFASCCASISSYMRSMDKRIELSKDERQVVDRLLVVVDGKHVMSDPRRSFEFGARWMTERLAMFQAAVEQVGDAAKDYGRDQKRIQFRYVLWYDIIDSRGKKSNLQGDVAERHSANVLAFKENIKKDIYGLRRDASRSDATIHSWYGALHSNDDEKHIFIAGARGPFWLQQVAKTIVDRARFHEVCVRVILIRGDFAAGMAPYKLVTVEEVEGPMFWEHFKSVTEQLKGVEPAFGMYGRRQPPQASIAWVSEGLSEELEFPLAAVRSENRRKQVVASAARATEIRTEFVGGRMNS
jgi:hypothetical protein